MDLQFFSIYIDLLKCTNLKETNKIVHVKNSHLFLKPIKLNNCRIYVELIVKI